MSDIMPSKMPDPRLMTGIGEVGESRRAFMFNPIGLLPGRDIK